MKEGQRVLFDAKGKTFYGKVVKIIDDFYYIFCPENGKIAILKKREVR